MKRQRKSFSVRKMVLFAMFGALMFVSKLIMEAIPNVHLLGMFTMALTIVYRWEALIPIYLYVMINGVYAGFSTWWIPYLYLWALLWAVTMLLPRAMKPRTAKTVYPLTCGLFGLSFGTLYAPAYALMFGLDLRQMVVWILGGLFSFDILQAVGNGVAGLLVYPLSQLLLKLESRAARNGHF